ncbi:polysaccharide deacetylase family protein [Azospirillum halopraeferens]|uniref:polysaccharide deacetylase family protein n=1 Tax=Azospirillum halopraeferens TaxID=34010 RepID=UPI0003FA4B1A|nr:polysaccharide deacetylase family protein [Azospirillum halopraeferens]
MRKDALGGLVRWSGLGWGLRALFARRRVTIVVYHDPDPSVLEEHLAFYARHYTFTTMDAVADALENGDWDALPAYPLVLTFDDGHRGNAALADLFRTYGVRPTIFLCSRIVGTHRPYWWKTGAAARLGAEALKLVPDAERRRRLAEAGDDPDADATAPQAMGWDDVRRLADCADFGAHTRTHPILPRCNDQQAEEEIALCRQELEEGMGGTPCRHFAFPNGDYGERDLAILRHAGYRTARTIEPGWNGPDTDPMRLKGFIVSDDATVPWLEVQLTGIPRLLRVLRRALRGARAAATAGTPPPTRTAGGPASA